MQPRPRAAAPRTWDDIEPGEFLPTHAFPLTATRLIMAAAGTRDHTPLHHDPVAARRAGAPDIVANGPFLLGMWEVAVREFVGLDGAIISIAGFRMTGFSVPGDTVTVHGRILDKAPGPPQRVTLELWSQTGGRTTVGPGVAVVRLSPGDA